MALTLPKSPSGEAAKSYGAYYTDQAIAHFLVRWAVREPHDSVLDPSFGGGVFLYSAIKRLGQLGGSPRTQIFGVEIDPAAYSQARQALVEHGEICPANFILGDFFDLSPGRIPSLTAVVGNPPFIRYQRFSGEGQAKAIARALSEGVTLSRLASSWAAFLVHSVAMLSRGGRLGMVIPMELGQAAYARPLLLYLARSFENVSLLTFRKRLFPNLSQDTLLLLAEGKGGQAAHLQLLDLERASDLNHLDLSRSSTQKVPAQEVGLGRQRMMEYLIPRKARELYHELSSLHQTRRLGELAEVGIGYVTGNNAFFHLSPDQVAEWGITSMYLQPAIRRGRGLLGLRFTDADWKEALPSKETGYLLHIGKDYVLPLELRRYITQGQMDGIDQAYKCRIRKPWYAVPQVYLPDAFLTYMSGDSPRLVVNEAGVVAPNSLHILRLHASSKVDAAGLACLWQTSLTRLSAEIEGRAMGGGMLKIEPKEAEKVVLATPNLPPEVSSALLEELDSLVRAGRIEEARNRADDFTLSKGLGLTRTEQILLRGAANSLWERRYTR